MIITVRTPLSAQCGPDTLLIEGGSYEAEFVFLA